MSMNPETTLQQLARVRQTRESMAGVLRYRMASHALGDRIRRYTPGGNAHALNLLYQYASEEHQLRLRIRRKRAIARGEQAPVPLWRLTTTLAGGKKIAFDITQGVTKTGSHETCDLLLPFPYISRQHLMLSTQFGGLFMQDTGSTNGTSVNGKTVREALLKSGDRLSLAGYTFVVESCGKMNGVFVA